MADKEPVHNSECIAPAAAHMLEIHRARILAAANHPSWPELEIRRECERYWWTAYALHYLSCGLTGATFYSVASSNELRRVANEIHAILGEDPLTSEIWRAHTPGFKQQ
jgi:hypothetical protein